ncbi:MAG: pilus assembly protein PilP [Pseudomonadota bacterium]|nr:pilus assembly protein PilP [Pseudomonadota bacterium]
MNTIYPSSNLIFKWALSLLVVCSLAACNQDKADLNAYIAQVKSQQKSDIEPIPVMKPYEKFAYAASNLRDPFVPTVIDVPQPAPEPVVDNGIRPDENRRKEVLEFFDLSQLQYVGTLEQERVWALVRAPDGVIHRVQTGNYMGQNNGKIMEISDSKLVLKEIVPQGGGGYIERETSVPAVEVN